MIKKSFWLVLLFITTLSLSGCFFDIKDDYEEPILNIKQNQTDENVRVTNEDNKGNNEETNESKINPEDIINKAIETNDSSVCEQISDEDWKNDCVASVQTVSGIDKIIEKGDIKSCESLESEEWKKNCVTRIKEGQGNIKKTQAIIDKAIESENIKICEQIDNENGMDSCKKNVGDILIFGEAVKNEDKSLCEKLEDDKREKCIDSVNNTIIVRQATEQRDYNLCDTLSKDSLKTHCKEMVRFSIIVEEAIEKKDMKICDKIEIESFRKECKGYIVENERMEKEKKEKREEEINQEIELRAGKRPISEMEKFCNNEGKEIETCVEFNKIMKDTPEDLKYLWVEFNKIGQGKIFYEIKTYDEFSENSELRIIANQLNELLEENGNNEEVYGYLENEFLPFIFKISLPNLNPNEYEKIVDGIIDNKFK